MFEYKVYFSIALCPEGVKGFHYEKFIENKVTFVETFTKYLCTDEQSEHVIKHIKSIHQESNQVTDLSFTNNGKFVCKVYSNYDDDDITEILWPGELGDASYLFIDGKIYNIVLEIDYIDISLDDEDKKDQHIYNGVYYADAMDMEAQMTEDVKWSKLRKQSGNDK